MDLQPSDVMRSRMVPHICRINNAADNLGNMCLEPWVQSAGLTNGRASEDQEKPLDKDEVVTVCKGGETRSPAIQEKSQKNRDVSFPFIQCHKGGEGANDGRNHSGPK